MSQIVAESGPPALTTASAITPTRTVRFVWRRVVVLPAALPACFTVLLAKASTLYGGRVAVTFCLNVRKRVSCSGR